MRERPLCIAALFLLAVQWILAGGFGLAKDLKPSELEQYARDGDKIVVCGQVYRREEKSGYDIYYMRDNQVLLKQNKEQETNLTESAQRKDSAAQQSNGQEVSDLIEESKILVYVKQRKSENQSIIETGNLIQVEGEVSFFEKPANPGNFNQKFYYQKQGIHAMVWGEKTEIQETKVLAIREELTQIRTAWKQLLTDAMGKTYGSAMSAILLGDKSELDTEVKTLYQKSGIGHILAISGLHMSFLGIGLYHLFRKAGIGFAPAGVTGIAVLFFYTLMIGAGVSALRAMIMYVVRMGAEICGRDYDLPTSLSLAAAVITLGQPLYLSDTGFLLSFGAILGIIMVNPVLEKCRWIPKVFAAGLAIQLTLLPVMLDAYFEISPWSILLNLLVIPLMSVVLAAGLAGSMLFVLWKPGGILILQLCKGILWLYEQGCALTMELPFARLVIGQPQIWETVLYYVILAALCLAAVKQRTQRQNGEEKKRTIRQGAESIRRKMPAGFQNNLPALLIVVLAVGFCLLTANSHGVSGELKVTMLDVGQGDGIYIRTPNGRHYFVDGGSSDVSNLGTYRLEPFLESQGVGVLDYVFISHGDKDHLSGIEEMLTNQKFGVRIETLVLPNEQVLDETLWGLAKTAEENGTRVVTISAGECLKEDRKGAAKPKFSLTCLAPATDYAGETGNAASMVLSLQYGSFDMLFTGDVEGVGEGQLTENGALHEIDVLKVAHHGSKNSTSGTFLEVTEPKIALISAGKDNSYGHPHEETLQRLESIGCQIYNTQKCGAVTVISDGEMMKVEGDKCE